MCRLMLCNLSKARPPWDWWLALAKGDVLASIAFAMIEHGRRDRFIQSVVVAAPNDMTDLQERIN